MTATKLQQAASALRRIHLTVILRLLVGGTFVFSSVTKLPDHSQFVDVVESYNILPHSLATAYGVVLPWVELVIGAYLVLGILVRLSSVVAVLMAISFVIANVSSIFRGDEYCGSCFGEDVLLLAWQSLIIDVLIIVAGLYLVIEGGRKQMLSFDGLFPDRERGANTAVSSDDDGGIVDD
jgi:uncharacterized membrane protein YphA (DoxX/SURF4 family)